MSRFWCSALIFGLCLLPAFAFAYGSASNPITQESDFACKTSSKSGSQGAVTGGGNDVSNYITIKSTGKVEVVCVPVTPGQKATVTFCDLNGKCHTVDKDSQSGANLMEMFSAAYDNGEPAYQGQARVIDSQALLTQMLSPNQMSVVDNSIIGRTNTLEPYNSIGSYLDYSSIVNAAGQISATTPPENGNGYSRDSLQSSLNDIINGYAATAQPSKPSFDDSISRIPGQPYRLDILTPTQNMLFYGPQYVPTFEPARAFTEADLARLNSPNPYTAVLNSNQTFSPPSSNAMPNITPTNTSSFSGFFQQIRNLFLGLF
jgi:hypothetical protein